MPFLAALAPLIGIGTAAGGATTLGSVLGALGTIGGIAGAGTTIGMDIAGAGGGKAPSATAPPPTPPPNAEQLLQQRQLVGQQSSNIESQTSGGAGPDFLALMAPYLAGISGQPGANAAGQYSANQAFTPANSQATNAAVQGQQVNLSDFINSNT